MIEVRADEPFVLHSAHVTDASETRAQEARSVHPPGPNNELYSVLVGNKRDGCDRKMSVV